MPRYLSLAFACLLAMAVVVPGSVKAADVKLADGAVLPDKPFYIVTYVEADPAKAGRAKNLIQDHSAASKKDAGNLRFEALQRIGQKNHFIILEAWADQDARNAHAKAAHTVAFRKALQPSLYSPFDERAHVGLVAADPKKEMRAGKRAVYVLTHVDIIPTEQIPPCKRQANENGPCGIALVKNLVAEGRKGAGNLRFDALTQANRPNHMEVVEVWKSAAAQNKHTVSKAVKDFRDELSGIAPASGVAADPTALLNPLTGSLYDERLYRSID
ncbi:MAG TPA: antibiotic biosynthesis monooxygenase [Pseudolabrys sp.]|nr:antibiotic biosynthesis monooxygenase [Pseudolabrys sp.]